MNDPDPIRRGLRETNLRRLLKPRHVAFVGGRSVVPALRQCLQSGFSGAIWPVNPKLTELESLRCYPDVRALPEAPDATFIAVAREATIDIVRALAEIGAGGCVCYAAGYAEVGPEGAALQDRLVEAAGDLALLGPNCYGLLNYLDGVALWFYGHGGSRMDRGVAIIAQSGNIALNLTNNDRSVPLAYVVSAGNQAVLSVADLVGAFAEDPQVSAIGLYLEGLTDVGAFADAAARARDRGVPIVAMKAGRSELGVRLAMSHTSSLAGSDPLYDALFDRLGIVRVASLPALLETLKLVSAPGPRGGERLAVFTCSGGDSLMTADRAIGVGLSLPELAPAQVTALREQLPAFATISNPLDYNTSLWGDRAALERCFATVLRGDFDAGLLVIDYASHSAADLVEYDAAVDALIAVGQQTGKLVAVVSTLPELLPAPVRQRILAAGAVPLQGLEDAIEAFAGAVAVRRRAQSLPLVPPGAMPAAPRLLPEAEAKQRLARFGLPVPEARLCLAADAPDVAAGLGFPVVLKLARPALAHKTEAQAVALGLETADAVAAAVARMTAALARRQPAIVPEQFLLERHVTGVVAEMIVGVRRDPQFGLALVIGAGGILVEMVEDSATLLLPTTREEVARAVSGLRVMNLLRGFRGKPAGDIEAVVGAVMSVAAFAEAQRDVMLEFDVNPLLVLPPGKGAVAADALLLLGEATAASAHSLDRPAHRPMSMRHEAHEGASLEGLA